MSLVYALNQRYDETFTANWVGTETLTTSLISGNTSSIKLTTDGPISGATSLISMEYTIDGTINSNQQLKIYMKFRKAKDIKHIPCGECIWSDNILISTITGNTSLTTYTTYFSGTTGYILNPSAPLEMVISIFRVDNYSLTPTNIYVSNVKVDGTYQIEYTNDFFTIDGNTTQMILRPTDIYKVFSISDFEVIYKGYIGDVNIKYRVTQDGGKRYSEWENLTTENISTYRFNELRFAQIEYLVTQSSTESSPVKIYDIILTGDFQNVSANYLKSNKYGLREDCLSKYLKDTGQVGISDLCSDNYMGSSSSSGGLNPSGPAYNYDKDFYTQGLSCYMDGSSIDEITAWNSEQTGLWNPYESTKINDFYNMLANQTADILSWEIDYHITDPDQNGIDMFLHEYQLMNVIDVKKVKVLVPDNKFPDNTVKMNSFNLDLFDTFEIHLMKDEFKNKFGIEKRPMEKDILYFCQINRLFYIKHAQIFRDVMNAGIYYKIILEKYEQKANYENLSANSKAMLDVLTKDTTMDELFGIEVENEMNKVANLDQTYPTTDEKMRKSMFSKVIITETSLYSGDMLVARNYYDFKNCIGKAGVTYKKNDRILEKSDNRSIVLWFNFNNKNGQKIRKDDIVKAYYVNRKNTFELLNNYDSDNNVGYKVNYQNGEIVLQLNDMYYKLESMNLLTNIWYQLVININQRQGELDLYLYKRDNTYKVIMMRDDHELASVVSTNTTGYTYLVNMGYKPIDNEEQYSSSEEYTLLYNSLYENFAMNYEHNIDISITASDIKYTNLRIFNDIIPYDSIGNILNQEIITDAQHLILADNVYKKLYTSEQNPIQKNLFDK